MSSVPPTVSIDARSPVPPFEQIRTQLVSQINCGALLAGTRLPTVRRLAADLGLATNTVARAYKELEAAGLVTTGRRAGTVVSATGDAVRQEAHTAAQEFARRMRQLGVTRSEAIALVESSLATTSA